MTGFPDQAINEALSASFGKPQTLPNEISHRECDIVKEVSVDLDKTGC